MTDRERELLVAMAARPGFTAMPVLMYYHRPLQAWAPRALSPFAAKLVRDGYAVRAYANPGRQSRYRITEAGRAILAAEQAALTPDAGHHVANEDQVRSLRDHEHDLDSRAGHLQQGPERRYRFHVSVPLGLVRGDLAGEARPLGLSLGLERLAGRAEPPQRAPGGCTSGLLLLYLVEVPGDRDPPGQDWGTRGAGPRGPVRPVLPVS